MQRRQDKCLMGCNIFKAGKHGPHLQDGRPTGLILNHAYGIQDVFTIKDYSNPDKDIKLLLLRNPWGDSEWNGAWGSNSAELNDKNHLEALKDYIATLPEDEQFDPDADDGTFLIPYRDWRDNFSTLFINNDFAEEWTGVRFKSAWTAVSCGGLPLAYNDKERKKFAANPQFLIKPKEDCEMMFSLQQTGGRLPMVVDSRDRKSYYEYPFVETLTYATVGVFNVGENKRTLDSFDKDALVYLAPIKRERENAGRVQLKANKTYIIVPSTEKEKQLKEFYLSVYLNKDLRDVEIKRVFHANDNNPAHENHLPQFIPEEAEKICNRAPTWKIQLVKESLKYMITDDDKEAY